MTLNPDTAAFILVCTLVVFVALISLILLKGLLKSSVKSLSISRSKSPAPSPKVMATKQIAPMATPLQSRGYIVSSFDPIDYSKYDEPVYLRRVSMSV